LLHSFRFLIVEIMKVAALLVLVALLVAVVAGSTRLSVQKHVHSPAQKQAAFARLQQYHLGLGKARAPERRHALISRALSPNTAQPVEPMENFDDEVCAEDIFCSLV
jgi:hypothetical protein